MTDLSGIQLRISGVKAHSSLGIGGRLHDPLRRIYSKVRADYPQAQIKVLRKIAVKAMNDTIGEKGLVLSLLVSGITKKKRHHILEEIGMTTSTTDGAFFFKKIGDQLAGLCATHVDDYL